MSRGGFGDSGVSREPQSHGPLCFCVYFTFSMTGSEQKRQKRTGSELLLEGLKGEFNKSLETRKKFTQHQRLIPPPPAPPAPPRPNKAQGLKD